MKTSHFDLLSHGFECPDCGNRFKEGLRGLLTKKEVICPQCRTAIDIRETKTVGQLGKDFDTASELDKLADEPK